MDGAQAFAIGGVYAIDKDTVFVDFIYSPTNPNINLPLLQGDVKNSILQMGYMTNFGKWRKSRLGLGLQFHQMDFINIKRMKRTTFFGLGEYDITRNKTLRFQSSIGLEKDNIRFGGDALMLLFKL